MSKICFELFYLSTFQVSADSLALDHVPPAYEILDSFHHGPVTPVYKFGSLVTITKEAAELNEAQELFELVSGEGREYGILFLTARGSGYKH